ncbi:MAG TPA: hypothetical protein VFX15_00205 [Actinomycetes bacterium]|nr:hypothetical protein [Actinomycetes bacterium]
MTKKKADEAPPDEDRPTGQGGGSPHDGTAYQDQFPPNPEPSASAQAKGAENDKARPPEPEPE